MGDSSELCSQKMSLFSWERRAAINTTVQVSSEDMLYHSGDHEMLWLDIRKLDPVTQKVIGDPIDISVGSSTPLLLFRILDLFL